jgi:uncharacterized lipoprotein YmbA
MKHARTWLVSIALLAAVGCSASPAARFYTLSSTATTEDAAAATYTVAVGPVSVPSAVDRPQFVVQVAPNQVEIDEFSRWAAPLEESIARAVAGNLVVLLGTPDVAVAPLASLTPAYRVSIDVQRFDSVRGEAVVIDAAWAVRAEKEMRAGRTLAREAVQGGSAEALTAAHSRALVLVSVEIAAAIREVAERPGKR